MIAAGKLTRQVTILEPVHSDNLVGEATVIYQPVREAWAEVTPITAIKRAAFKQVEMKATIQVKLRYWDGLTIQHRVCFEGVTYAIETLVNDYFENETWTMTCSVHTDK
jgi:SPP1 family predicted phage head-tail adaptor